MKNKTTYNKTTYICKKLDQQQKKSSQEINK